MTSNEQIDHELAKRHLESAPIEGAARKGHHVPRAGSGRMFIVAPEVPWSVAHVPTGRFLVRASAGLTQREAFKRAAELFEGGKSAGVDMNADLTKELARITPDELSKRSPESQAFIEELRKLLTDSET